MKKKYFLIVICLLICLFIYLFYRTEKTVINKIFISVIPIDQFVELRKVVTNTLPLNEHIVYSLPEGLWVFCITLTSKSLYLNIRGCEIDLMFIPLIFSISLEILQLLHITNGRFDIWDIGFSLLFWATANYLIIDTRIKQSIVHPFTTRGLICLLSYLIVYLAHV